MELIGIRRKRFEVRVLGSERGGNENEGGFDHAATWNYSHHNAWVASQVALCLTSLAQLPHTPMV